jgi:single-strand DNA-binding protein
MANSFSCTGRLGGDPEWKTHGETGVLEFSIANDVGYGERKKTNWFRCSMWGDRGLKLRAYLQKGNKVFVVGELTNNEYKAQDGTMKFSSDLRLDRLDFCESKPEQK